VSRGLKIAIVVAIALIVGIAIARAQQPPTSPLEQALGSKLMEEINQNVQARASIITLQQQLKAAQAELAKQKPDGKPTPPAAPLANP
jgi:hypothetical protein